MNHTLMNQTAERMIRDIEAGRSSMGAVCAEWNRLCSENGFPNQKIRTPGRRSALAENLRMMQTMINYGDKRTDEEGNDPREWCGNDIEAAHAEALIMNEWCGFTEEQRDTHNKRVSYGCNLMHKTGESNVIDACHAAALLLNDVLKTTVSRMRASA